VEQIVVRPVPNENEVAAIKSGAAKASVGVSASWYEKGALVAADGALWLLDAEGDRHDIPCPPGGRLIRSYLWSPRGNASFYWTLCVTDEHVNRFADLPTYGFEKVGGLDALAAAVHLTFVEASRDLLRDKPQDRHKAPDYIDLEGACLAYRDRSALGRLVHRSDRRS
jgi:hypothetical protein